jgi:hypothetical protein
MKKSRQEVKITIDEALRRGLVQPPTPLYQKIVILVLVVGALFAVLAVLFFR